MKILAIPIAAVIVIGAIAGLSLSGSHFSQPSTKAVYVGNLSGVGEGNNSTAVWVNVKNIGNGTATIAYHFLYELDNSKTVANITDDIALTPGSETTLYVQATYGPTYNLYVFGDSGHLTWKFPIPLA